MIMVAPQENLKNFNKSVKRGEHHFNELGGLLWVSCALPYFFCSGYRSSMRVTWPSVASSMRRARLGEGRTRPRRTAFRWM